MRVVFMGTPDFAARILEYLIPEFQIVGVYTRPDAIRGRGKKLTASPVKEAALAAGLDVYTPRTLRDEQTIAQLAALKPDVICVAAYGAILPHEVLDIPLYGCLNVHGSLLPRWRGAAPIERSILAGDDYAGVCIMKMEEGLDTGDYCLSERVAIGSRSAAELTCELAEIGGQLLVKALHDIQYDKLCWTAQDEDLVTYAEKIGKCELYPQADDAADVIARKVQASSEQHPSKMVIAGKPLTLQQVRVVSFEAVNEGTLPNSALPQLPDIDRREVAFVSKRLFMGTSDGILEILKVKPDGKKQMDAVSFAAGIQGIKKSFAHWGEYER